MLGMVPLLVIPFLLYNFGLAGLFGDTGGDPFAAEAFSVTLMSGGVWTMSAGDLLNFYFDSKNMPAPNRMNWNDPQTDELLKKGKASLTDADRAKYYGLAQQRVTEEHLWMPVMNIAMYTTSLKKLKGVRPHMLYQNTFYKGLDYSFYAFFRNALRSSGGYSKAA